MTRCAILCLAVAALAVPSPAAEPKRGGTLVVAGGAGLRHLNPAVQSGAQTGLGVQLFAGLVRVDDKFDPHPYLAERWEISGDELSYTFHLTRNARFHDGKQITSDDVAFSLAVVKENHPFGTAMFDAVDRVDTPDPYTAVIRLSRPHPALMQSLVPLLMPVIPKHVFGDGRDPRTHPMNAMPVGSGPFRFKEWVRGQHVILERNDDFFIEGRPWLDRIVVKYITEPSVRMLALEKGEVDYYPFRWPALPRHTEDCEQPRSPRELRKATRRSDRSTTSSSTCVRHPSMTCGFARRSPTPSTRSSWSTRCTGAYRTRATARCTTRARSTATA